MFAFETLRRRAVVLILVIGMISFSTSLHASWVMETVAGEVGVSDPALGGLGSTLALTRTNDGTFYVAGGSVAPYVMRISTAGVVSVFAGTGNTTYNFTGSATPATSVNMQPTGVAIDADGDILIADGANAVVYRATAGGTITGQVAGVAGDTSGTGGSIGVPGAIAFNADGDIFIGSTGMRPAVFRVDGSSGATSVFAGNAGPTFNGLSGDATTISLAGSGLDVDGDGNVYIADSLHRLVRMVTPSGDLTTLAGEPGDNSGIGDSIGTASAVALDGEGGFFVAGGATAQIYHVDDTGTRTIFAGSGTSSPFNGDGDAGDPLTVNFATVDFIFQDNVLYVADAVHRLVRKIEASNTPPSDLVLVFDPSEVNEGANYSLSGSFTDPDTEDEHTVVIDWGDGEAEEVINLPLGARSFGPITRTAPAGPDSRIITVTVEDSEEETVSDSVTLTVLDITPPEVSLGADRAAQVGLPVAGTYTATDDGSGVASVQLYVKLPGGEWEEAGSTDAGTWSFDNSEELPLTGGVFGFYLVAEDNAGNSSGIPDASSDPMAETVVNPSENAALTLDVATGTEVELFFPMHGEMGVTVTFAEVLTAGTLTVERLLGTSNPAALTGLTVAGERWAIEPGGGLDFALPAGVTVRFDFDRDALAGVEAADLFAIWSIDSSETATPWPSAFDLVEDTATASEVTGFSEWYLATEATSVGEWQLLDR